LKETFAHRIHLSHATVLQQGKRHLSTTCSFHSLDVRRKKKQYNTNEPRKQSWMRASRLRDESERVQRTGERTDSQTVERQHATITTKRKRRRNTTHLIQCSTFARARRVARDWLRPLIFSPMNVVYSYSLALVWSDTARDLVSRSCYGARCVYVVKRETDGQQKSVKINNIHLLVDRELVGGVQSRSDPSAMPFLGTREQLTHTHTHTHTHTRTHTPNHSRIIKPRC
jgi:hypothetical protein